MGRGAGQLPHREDALLAAAQLDEHVVLAHGHHPGRDAAIRAPACFLAPPPVKRTRQRIISSNDMPARALVQLGLHRGE